MKTLRISDSVSVLICLTPSLPVTRVSQSTMLSWTSLRGPIGRTRASRLITKDCWVAGVISQLPAVAAGSWVDVRRDFAGEHSGGEIEFLAKVGSKAADHKILNEGVSRAMITGMRRLCKTWQHGHKVTRAKPKTYFTRNDEKLGEVHHFKSKASWKVVYTDNSLEFGKVCEDLQWNHCPSTRSETNGISERAVRGVKESTSMIHLQSVLDE